MSEFSRVTWPCIGNGIRLCEPHYSSFEEPCQSGKRFSRGVILLFHPGFELAQSRQCFEVMSLGTHFHNNRVMLIADLSRQSVAYSATASLQIDVFHFVHVGIAPLTASQESIDIRSWNIHTQW
jgi:hypothetical protein